jgi:hypothetical protein
MPTRDLYSRWARLALVSPLLVLVATPAAAADEAERVVRSAAALEGQGSWVGALFDAPQYQRRDDSDLSRWVSGELRELPAHPKVSCWELLLVAGVRANLIARPQLLALHRRALKRAIKARGPRPDTPAEQNAALERGYETYLQTLLGPLGAGRGQPLSAAADPRPGDVVFVGPRAEHVALVAGKGKTGEVEAIHLPSPEDPLLGNGRQGVRRCTLKQLGQWAMVHGIEPHQVTIARNPWRHVRRGRPLWKRQRR